jgi:hypothetical protein
MNEGENEFVSHHSMSSCSKASWYR